MIKKPASAVMIGIDKKSSAFWMRERERALLELFHAMSVRVPAYKDFLRKNGIVAAKIRTFADFQNVPIVTKNNYLRVYPLEKLLWDGTAARGQVFTVTSGSTGAPFYFPRTEAIDDQSTAFHKLFLDYLPHHKRESTLVVVGFGMGAWIGGILTYQAFTNLARREGYPISIFTPGANKKEIFEGVRSLAGKFDHLILCGYPPFLKDVIDEGAQEGIIWKDHDVRIIFAAEAFSEEMRDHVMRAAGIKDPYRGTMNIYGSADLGTMAAETPVSICLRRLALSQPKFQHRLFKKDSRLPTFAQFNPKFTNFESVNGEVLCSGNNALPLLRYAIGDNGEVSSFAEVAAACKEGGIDIKKKFQTLGLESTVRELPFVSVYERSDFSTKLYGAIIYPEHVKRATYDAKIAKYITGKFHMATKSDKNHDQYLEVNVELRPGVVANKTLERSARDAIEKKLLKYNGEYAYLSTLMPGKVVPRVTLCRHEHPDYFAPRGKQHWVEKNNSTIA